MNNRKCIDIADRIENKKLTFEKIHAERLEDNFTGVAKEVTVQINAETNYTIIEHTTERLKFKAEVNFGINPKSIFQIDFELIVDCKLKEPIESEIQEETFNEIMREYGADISLMIGVLTERLLKKPLILPPMFRID